MAKYLARLGRASSRHRRLVAVIWLAVFVAFAVGASTLSGTTTDDFSLPGTEAQEAGDLVAERFDGAQVNAASAQVVFQAPDGGTLSDPTNAAVVAQSVDAFAQVESVISVSDPFDPQRPTISPDQTVAIVNVQLDADPGAVEEADQEELVEVVTDARASGLTVEVGGTALLTEQEPPASEAVGVMVALVVLLVTFGSVVAAGLPLLTALTGVGIGIMGVTIATGFVELSSSVSTLALMLGLAVGIDYALLIVSRYRHEIATGRQQEEAISRAAGTAGTAVLFAGVTVMIALVGLSIVGIPFLTAMGLAAAGTVGAAVLVALTLLPALLSFGGPRIMPRSWRRSNDFSQSTVSAPTSEQPAPVVDVDEVSPRGGALARTIVRRRVPVIVVGVLSLAALSVPALSIETSLPTGSSAPSDTTERRAYDVISEGFGPGFNSQLLVVVDLADVTDATDVTGVAEAAGDAVSQVDGVAFVSPPQLNSAGDAALISIIPISGPDDPGTVRMVQDIRSAAPGLADETGATVFVTGVTAVNIDTSAKLSAALPTYLLVVIGLAVLLLLLVFRSILVPLTAVAGFLLSIGAALGATVAVFQWGHLEWLFDQEAAPIISFMPIFLTGVLFGLAMDYQVFLVSRIREEYVHGAAAREAITAGYQHGSKVITAAALIMISVFSGFMFAPDVIIKSIGFALAFGVFIDAFVVRMLLVPATLALLGDSAWWLPSWLDRVLPNVDIEGESLARSAADDTGPARTPVPVA